MIAHVQAVAVAESHVGQIGGLDLDDGNIVVLVAADILGVIAVAIIQRDLHGVRVAYHMVVGHDVAVRRQDEAGTSPGSLCGLAEEIGVRGSCDVDGHHAVDVGGVQLRVRHGILAVHGFQLDLRRLAVGDVHLRGVAVGTVAYQISGAAAYQTAQQSAHQRQRGDLQAQTVLAVLVGRLPALRLGLIHRLGILSLLLLLLTVAVELLVHGGLLGVIVLARLCAVLAIGVVIQILFIVIHKSNLLEKRALICVPPGTSLTLIVV